jgi:hypothetical protein
MKKISGSGAWLTEPFVVGGRVGGQRMQGKGAPGAQRPAEASAALGWAGSS